MRGLGARGILFSCLPGEMLDKDMAARHVPWISPDEYLDEEERSKTRHVYHAGVVAAMALEVRGYGHVKEAAAARYHEQLASRLSAFEAAPDPQTSPRAAA